MRQSEDALALPITLKKVGLLRPRSADSATYIRLLISISFATLFIQ